MCPTLLIVSRIRSKEPGPQSEVGRWRLGRRGRAVCVCVTSLAALVLALAFGVLPLLPVHLSVVVAEQHSTPTPRVFTQDYWIENNGRLAETVTAADTDAPGVVTVKTSIGRPVTIKPGGTLRVVMTYRVTDCRVTQEALPVKLRLSRWWGTRTETVQDLGVDFDGASVACMPVIPASP